MRYRFGVVLMLGLLLSVFASVTSTARADSERSVPYEVSGKKFEGYFVSPSPNAPLVLLVHDWDGLTAYDIKRANMLADLGYSVFAADLYGAGVRPTELEDKRRHTSELYADRERMRSYLQAALRVAESKGADVGNACRRDGETHCQT